MKKVLIINGNPNEENYEFDEYCGELSKIFLNQGNEVREIALSKKRIDDCIGCYACWFKTPGICALHDDQEEVLKGYTWSDFIVIASPIIMGFVSALAKKSYDRIIPLVHPFLRIDNDRMAHYPRYDKPYNIGVLLDHAEQDEIDIIKKVFKSAVLIKTMSQSAEEVAHEINNF